MENLINFFEKDNEYGFCETKFLSRFNLTELDIFFEIDVISRLFLESAADGCEQDIVKLKNLNIEIKEEKLPKEILSKLAKFFFEKYKSKCANRTSYKFRLIEELSGGICGSEVLKKIAYGDFQELNDFLSLEENDFREYFFSEEFKKTDIYEEIIEDGTLEDNFDTHLDFFVDSQNTIQNVLNEYFTKKNRRK